MTEKPPTPDPEQQRADNEASRRQSGLDPARRDGVERENDRAARKEAGENRPDGERM